jgi:hypothetical protein
MIPLAAQVETAPSTNPWVASLYAGLATAVLAIIFSFVVQTDNLIWILFLLLIGAGPVIGYGLATRTLGSQVGAIIGGIIGMIIPFLLWPILVGALSKNQSIGKLIIAAIIAFILGIIVFLILASAIGQPPSWFATGGVFLFAVWGGTLGAAMVAWGKR